MPRSRGKGFCSYVFERVIFFVDFDLVYIAGFSIAAELLPATQASAVYLVMTKEVKSVRVRVRVFCLSLALLFT